MLSEKLINKESTSKTAMAYKALHVISYGKVRSWEVRADFMTIDVAVPSWAFPKVQHEHGIAVTVVLSDTRL